MSYSAKIIDLNFSVRMFLKSDAEVDMWRDGRTREGQDKSYDIEVI